MKGATTAIENVEKFEELLRGSEELQTKLQAAGQAFDGDRADERAVFDAIIAPLAQEAGLAFTLDEARERISAGRDIHDMDLESVAGGKGLCYTIGGNREEDKTWACTHEDFGAGACSYIGVGFASYE